MRRQYKKQDIRLPIPGFLIVKRIPKQILIDLLFFHIRIAIYCISFYVMKWSVLLTFTHFFPQCVLSSDDYVGKLILLILPPSSVKPENSLHNVWQFLIIVLQQTLPVDHKNRLRRLKFESDLKGDIGENCNQACGLFSLLLLDWISGAWMMETLLHKDAQDFVMSKLHFIAPRSISAYI